MVVVYFEVLSRHTSVEIEKSHEKLWFLIHKMRWWKVGRGERENRRDNEGDYDDNACRNNNHNEEERLGIKLSYAKSVAYSWVPHVFGSLLFARITNSFCNYSRLNLTRLIKKIKYSIQGVKIGVSNFYQHFPIYKFRIADHIARRRNRAGRSPVWKYTHYTVRTRQNSELNTVLFSASRGKFQGNTNNTGLFNNHTHTHRPIAYLCQLSAC